MKIIFKLLIINSIVFSSLAQAQTWRSSLYPTTWTPKGNFYTDKIIQDFSYAGYHRGEKAIPTVTTNIVNVTLLPYLADKTGATDVTAKIQKAIDDVSAAGGGVVYLPAGTYRVSPGTSNHCLMISKSNVVLRGAGKDLTFILNSSYQMQNKSIIKVQGNSGWYGTENNKTKITKDLTGPVKDIPVQSAAAYKVGDIVVLRNYINDAWITEHNMTQWLGYGSSLQGLAFCREVMKVDYTNNIITVDAPIRYSMLTRDNSSVYKVFGMISEVGVESLAIGNVQNPATTGFGENDFTISGTPAYDSHASAALTFSGVVNGWANNVNTFKPLNNTSTAHILSNGLVINQSKNLTIQNCHFQRPQYGGGGGNGYMYRITGSENLITLCIAEYMRHGFVFSSMASSGNVIYKCNDIKTGTGTATGSTGYYKTSGSGSDHHMHFSTSNLIDQCTTTESFFAAGFRNYGSTPIHGLTAAHSVYWNMTGNGTTYPEVVHTQQARYGYAIGTSGNAAAVNTGELSLPGSSTITAPIDHVEGVGTGATLVPQSLYIDQLSKRLNSNACANNINPTIQLTSSVTSAIAPASITLNAVASDAGGSISKVDFYDGTVLLGSIVTAPYTFPLTNVTAGTHTYTSKATDNCNAVTTSAAVNVMVSSNCVNNTLPTVSVTSSVASNIAPASVTLNAVATDAGGSISKVEFYEGSVLLGYDLTSPYAFSLTHITAGTHTYTAKATDNCNGVTTSTAVSVVINAANILPTVSLTSPASGSSFSAPATISLAANATDSDGTIAKVEFYNGTTLLGLDATSPYSYSWSSVAAGSYSLTAKAYDNQGGIKTSTAVVITVSSPPTTIGISGPSTVTIGSTNLFTVTTETNATTVAWWANGDATITVDPTNSKKANVKVNSGSGSITIICGVNYSTSPYYKEYSKTVTIGTTIARMADISISPYPAQDVSTVKLTGEKILQVRIISLDGRILSSTLYNGEEEVQVRSDLPAGLYIIQVVSENGIQNKQYLKVD